MINRANWSAVRAYLKYKTETMRRSTGTVRSNRTHLVHLMEWAGERSFERAPAIRPTLPDYMEALISGRSGKRLNGGYLTAFFAEARHFLEWARREHPTDYKRLSASWLETLRPSPERGTQATLRKREIYTVEEAIRLAKAGMEHEDLTMRRTGAAVAMMFLSGMRIGAFLTLPIDAVDLEKCEILQLPELGVATKKRKAAKTTLLQIPELIDVITQWDELVRAKLPGTAYWYPNLDQDAEFSQRKPGQAARLKHNPIFRMQLLRLCAETGVAYKSAHKLRHGHAVWALKQAKTMEEMKSISQNLMHKNMGITDEIYGKLVDDDVHRAILGLGKKMDHSGSESMENANMERMIEEAVRRVMKEKE